MPRNLFATAAILPLVIACASAGRAQDHELSPRQLALVDQTCGEVLGLKRGEAYFAGCQESLSGTLAAGNDGGVMAADTVVPVGLSFYEVPPHVQWERERESCTRLGLPPASNASRACVASLQGAFLPRLN